MQGNTMHSTGFDDPLVLNMRALETDGTAPRKTTNNGQAETGSAIVLGLVAAVIGWLLAAITLFLGHPLLIAVAVLVFGGLTFFALLLTCVFRKNKP